MATIEWLGADKLRPPEKSGPETYAPPNRRPPEKLSDVDQAAANVVESEIREFVRRDVAYPNPKRSAADPANNTAAKNLNDLIGGVAASSMDEIDRVIRELESVREMLRNEGERVNREVAGYASLSHAAVTSMKVIADSLKQWKDAPANSGSRSVS